MTLPSASKLPRPCVLLVDDTPSNIIALSAVIGQMDVEVVGVTSGDEALAAVATRDFAVILLDLMMPGLDGFHVLERLTTIERARGTPVIVVTALSSEEKSLTQAYTRGAADYLTKPVDVDILRAKIKVFIALWERGQQLVIKDRHMAVLAHDLRTPLSIIGAAAARLEAHADPDVRLASARITRASTRMTKLAEDVLQFARASASSIGLTATEVDLVSLCSNLLQEFGALHTDTTFVSEFPAQLSGFWDAARLEQAISNLVANAVKYGRGEVRVRLTRDADGAHISVENAGAPIARERLATIFEPFEQGSMGRNGVGLGLFIVREIARAHAGKVTVDSDEQKTAFCLHLPVRVAPPA